MATDTLLQEGDQDASDELSDGVDEGEASSAGSSDLATESDYEEQTGQLRLVEGESGGEAASDALPEEEVREPEKPDNKDALDAWDARTVEVDPIEAAHEAETVLVQIATGADVEELNRQLAASGCVLDGGVTDADVERGYVELAVNAEDGYDVEHAMLQLQQVEGLERPQPNYLYEAVDTQSEDGEEVAPVFESDEQPAPPFEGAGESLPAVQDSGDGLVPSESPQDADSLEAEGESPAPATAPAASQPTEDIESGGGAGIEETPSDNQVLEPEQERLGGRDTAEADFPDDSEGEDLDGESDEEDREAEPETQAASTNDPKASEQWMLKVINAFDAWDKVKANGGATVAIMDTGCRMTHEDLVDNIVYSYDATESSGVEDNSKDGHGTHVAGVVAAAADNGKGIAGVSYNAGIVPIQVFVDSNASTTTIAQAYDWVIENASYYNIRVVNLSVGVALTAAQEGTYKDDIVVRKARQAYEAGILTVVAAGNYAEDKGGAYASYPCDVMDFALGVIALQQGTGNASPTRASYSNYNRSGEATKDISAPGTSIYSTHMASDASYSSLSGTSFSAPCVAAVAALLFTAKPELTPQQVSSIICDSAQDLGASGWDAEYGAGMVDASAAIDGLGEYLEGPSSLMKGDTVQLVPSFNTDWAWSSSNSAVASVSGGMVTGVSGGTAVISAKYGKTTVSRTVTVYDVGFRGDTSLQVDHALKLAFDENPEIGMWLVDSDDPKVATVAVGASGITVYGVGAGSTTIRATLASNKALVVTWPITVNQPKSKPIDLAEATWPVGFEYSAKTKPYVYTGAAIQPKPSKVLYTSYAGATAELKEGVDYTLSYSNNVNASSGGKASATVTLTGKGTYSGSKKYSFYIWPRELSDSSVKVGAIASQYYTGKAISPVPGITYSGKALANKTDFTVKYGNNTKTGTATATITGTGNFTGSRAVSFKIINKPSLSGPATVYASSKTTYTVKNGSIAIKARSGAADAKVSGAVLVAGKKTGSVTLSLRNSEGEEYATKKVTIASASGYWTLASALNGGYVMDIAGGSLVNGGNLQIYKSNGSLAQKYQLVVNSDGTYTIKSAKTQKTLDVAGASKSNGANVQQYSGNSTGAQKWTLSMDASGRVTFANKNSGKVLDVKGGKAANSANVQQYASNGSAAQKWTMKKTSADVGVVPSGQYRVSSGISASYVLDVAAGSKNNSANVQLYASNGTGAQKWNIEYQGKGIYKITNANSGKALDVAGGSKANSANVQQYGWNASNAQKWKLTKNSGGTYSLANVGSGKVLDVSGGVAANGRNVQQYTSNGTKAQKWKLVQY